MKNKKAICIHFHIYKNAGTTIDWILEKNFSQNAVKFDKKNKVGYILPLQVILEKIKSKNDVQSFSSHQIRFPLPQTTDFNLIPIVFLRNPIERAFSIYADQKILQGSKNVITENAHNMAPREFFSWCLDSNFYYIMKNFQTIFLSSRDNHHKANSDDFNQAIQRMKDCTILGLVERFDESMVLAEEILQDYFNDIDLSYIKQNVSLNRRRNSSGRFTFEKSIIGDVLMDELFEHNKFDIQLYSYVEKELNNRIKKIKDFEIKLSDFRNRCKKYNKT